MIDTTNTAWGRDRTGLYFVIELGPHNNNTYTQYPFGGSVDDMKFRMVDLAINYRDQLATGENITDCAKVSFELDDQVIAAGGSIPGGTFVRSGFTNEGDNHFAIFQFIEVLDETMAGTYQFRYRVNTNLGRQYAGTFRIKIIKSPDSFHSERDNFTLAQGELHGII